MKLLYLSFDGGYLLTDPHELCTGILHLSQVMAVALRNALSMCSDSLDRRGGLLTGLKHGLRLRHLLFGRPLCRQHHLLQLTGTERHSHTALTGIGNHLLQAGREIIVAFRHACDLILSLYRQSCRDITILVFHRPQDPRHAVNRSQKKMTHEKQRESGYHQGEHQHGTRDHTGGVRQLRHLFSCRGCIGQHHLQIPQG